jgi:hypothetical protein
VERVRESDAIKHQIPGSGYSQVPRALVRDGSGFLERERRRSTKRHGKIDPSS